MVSIDRLDDVGKSEPHQIFSHPWIVVPLADGIVRVLEILPHTLQDISSITEVWIQFVALCWRELKHVPFLVDQTNMDNTLTLEAL
jgi:hypothetical protein